MDVHHVGVATDDAAGLADLYGDLLGASVVHEERFEGLRVVFLGFADGGTLELLEPLDAADGGPVASYLDRRGPGVHHVAFATADIEAALDRARDLGVELIDEAPRPGARGHEVAFLHPGSTGGVLVEFVAEGS
jgi:methylmalonyl-CoA/ethylmalonyl-CoA epimerase